MITATTLAEAAQKAVAPRAREAGSMSILIDKKTRLMVHGITGREGMFHAAQMLEYGTKIVAGDDAGQGRRVGAGRQGAGLRHGQAGRRGHGRQLLGDLRPGQGGRRLPCSRRPTPAWR